MAARATVIINYAEDLCHGGLMCQSLRMLLYLVQVDAAGKQTEWINNTSRVQLHLRSPKRMNGATTDVI